MAPYRLIAKTQSVRAGLRQCGGAHPCKACPSRGRSRAARGCPVMPPSLAEVLEAISDWEVGPEIDAVSMPCVDPWEGGRG